MHKSDPAKRAAQTLIIKALFKTCTAYAALNKTELDWASTQNECSTLTMQSDNAIRLCCTCGLRLFNCAIQFGIHKMIH